MCYSLVIGRLELSYYRPIVWSYCLMQHSSMVLLSLNVHYKQHMSINMEQWPYSTSERQKCIKLRLFSGERRRSLKGNMAAGISVKHGLLNSKNWLYLTAHTKISPGSSCVLRAASSASGDAQHNEKFCLDLVRWVQTAHIITKKPR